MSLIGILIAHVVGALTLALVPGSRRRTGAAIAAGLMASTLLWGLIRAETVLDGQTITETLRWIPSLDVGLTMRIDPLAVIFIILIAGIGLAIVGFGATYMRNKSQPNRFLALLVLFAGSMIGLAAADNVFGLFVFWELTTITSYLLIGFDDEKAGARAAAFQAILTTGLGGLVLLSGLVLLTQAAGTASLIEIVSAPPTGTLSTVALVLVLIGAFTKSAQVPFHFWLPGAMAAPTPASAYLHSATMVKAGILILIRLAPGFSEAGLWTPVVVSVGLATMALGAWRALRQTDLKLLLAYGTVSQLGFMTALTGLGTPGLLHAAVAVLIGHALFKSALFLTVGAVEAIGGTRDLRELSGVGRRHPLLGLAGGMAAASMAGVAPLLGFVTKEAAFAALIEQRVWLPLLVIAAASAATVAYSIRFWWGAFGGKADATVAQTSDVKWWRPGDGLWVPPLSLAALGLALGLVPGAADRFVSAVSPGAKLVLWPGWKPALAVSAVVLVVGAIMHVVREPIGRIQSSFSRKLPAGASGEAAYRGSVSLLNLAADRTTGLIQHGSLPLYLAVILLATVGAPAAAFLLSGGDLAIGNMPTSVAEIGLAILIIAPAVALLGARQRMAAVLLLGAVGFSMAGLFVLYGAPDLALTLLLVETVVVAIFALVLARLPRRFEQRNRPIRRVVRATVALTVGSFVTVAALLAGAARPEGPIPSDAYADLAPAAGGTNVVNVILTDFRALDTLGEITVIATAAIGVAALVSGLRGRPRETT